MVVKKGCVEAMKFEHSARPLMGFLIFSIFGALVCAYYTLIFPKSYTPDPKLLGGAWVCLFVFSFTTVLFLYLVVKPSRGVEFTAASIFNHRSRWPEVSWKEVEKVSFSQVQGFDFLHIHPGPNFPSQIKLDPDGTASFGFVGLKPAKREAIEWLQENQPHLLA